MRYPIKGRLKKKEAKRPTRTEEIALFTPKPPTTISMNGKPQAPTAYKEANIDATPLVTFTEQHNEQMRTSKGFDPVADRKRQSKVSRQKGQVNTIMYPTTARRKYGLRRLITTANTALRPVKR